MNPDFNLLQLGVRFYDSETGRFTQRDLVESAMDYYTYSLNRPVSLVDPRGLTPTWPGKGRDADSAQCKEWLRQCLAQPVMTAGKNMPGPADVVPAKPDPKKPIKLASKIKKCRKEVGKDCDFCYGQYVSCLTRYIKNWPSREDVNDARKMKLDGLVEQLKCKEMAGQEIVWPDYLLEHRNGMAQNAY